MSKALPIRAPNYPRIQPPPPLSTSAFPPLPSSRPPLGSFVPQAYNNDILKPAYATGLHSGQTVANKTRGRQDQGNAAALDVYASAFVPHALTYINTLPGQQIDTPPLRQFNFDPYVLTHVGVGFLPHIPPFPDITLPLGLELVDSAFSDYYAIYFRSLLELEQQALEKEHESYALYVHKVTVLSLQGVNGLDGTCSFVVPGLRENTPFLEEDDIIQLRQFTFESMNQRGLWISNSPAIPSHRFPIVPIPEPRWNHRVLNGRVSGLQRKEEKVFMTISGLQTHQLMLDILHSPSKQVPCSFNIQFPYMKERHLPMFQVLPVIQAGLHQPTSFYQPSSTGPGVQPSFSISPSIASRNWLLSMLAPTEEDCAIQAKLNPISFERKFFDAELNWQQQKAAESVCARNYGIVPFLISGPPGTGKTKTLVEIALQLVKNESSHILFCAPSDPAADTLVQRLSRACKPGELLRLNRTSRSFAEVPNTILPFCYVAGDTFSIPPFRQLMSYKIIVARVVDMSILMHARVGNTELYMHEHDLRTALHPNDEHTEPVKLHWTALLMDEAAQAIEPEALIPLSIVAPPLDCDNLAVTPVFVMAGDEFQLGPRVALRTSLLKTSLFARLFKRPVYTDHPLARSKTGKDPPPLTKGMLPITRPAFANLVRNYRSHPAILAVPSAQFYNDTLEPHAASTDRLLSWDVWQGKKWPVLFYNSENIAIDEQELNGGGWYNDMEAKIACNYASNLVQSKLVQQNEVCIMSPFKAQVKRLREMIRKPKYGSLWDVDVGPTEAFQGLERGVVILCTTRSKERFVQKDIDAGWGVVGQPNKMNVALTRAKFGLIVIGSQQVLELDKDWTAFMAFCGRNGLWDGNEWKPVQGEKAAATRLERVLLGGEEEAEEERRVKAMKVWGRGVEDEMWIAGVQAEENDMGSSEGEDMDSEHDDTDEEEDAIHHESLSASSGGIGRGTREVDDEDGMTLTGLREHL